MAIEQYDARADPYDGLSLAADNRSDCMLTCLSQSVGSLYTSTVYEQGSAEQRISAVNEIKVLGRLERVNCTSREGG
jgi:hypothetical protein